MSNAMYDEASRTAKMEQIWLDYLGTRNSQALFDLWDRLHGCMDSSVNPALFPYQTKCPLPAPIPTVQEIAAAMTSQGHITCRLRLGPYFIKVDTNNRILQEAENMIYLEENSTVRTAKVYAAFSSQEVNPAGVHEPGTPNPPYHYLITEFIEGVTVDDLMENEGWLGGTLLRKIADMLIEQLRKLRDVSPENPNHFGRVNGQPFGYVGSLRYPEADKLESPTYGPFTYDETVRRMIHSGKIAAAHAGTEPFLTHELRPNIEKVLITDTTPSDRLPVLSHMDIKFNNAIVKAVRDKDNKVVDVEYAMWIDWEMLSWMPTWFEPIHVYKWAFLLNPVNEAGNWGAFRSQFGYEGVEGLGHFNIVPFCFHLFCWQKCAFEFGL